MCGPLFALGEVERVSTRVAVKITTHEEGARKWRKVALLEGCVFHERPLNYFVCSTIPQENKGLYSWSTSLHCK